MTWRYDNGDTLAILAGSGQVQLHVRAHQDVTIILSNSVEIAKQIRDELSRAIAYLEAAPMPPPKPSTIPER